jgi:predicted DNA-binding WGR domain protein
MLNIPNIYLSLLYQTLIIMSKSYGRWEAPSNSGGKFWEVSLQSNGTTVETLWGKLDSAGRTTTKEFDEEEKAIKFIETTIKKKEKEGYIKR